MQKTFFLNSTLADYGEEEWNYLQKFLLQQGILNSQGADYNDFADLKVTQNGAGNMSVNVALGVAVINTIRNSVTFKVFVSNQAIENLVVANNTSGSNRIDPVILKISRTVEPNALMSNVATLQVLTGTGVSAMTDNAIQTAIGADYDFIRLANLTVANNATQILTANISDTRIRCYTTDTTVPNPTIIKFRQLSADPTTPAEGEMWYNTTANLLRYYDGASTINIQASTYTGGNGINITAGVVSAVAGDGITVNASGIHVNPLTAKLYETLPAYESLVAGDLLKPYNDAGTIKIKKIHGVKDTQQTTTTVANLSQANDCSIIKLTSTLSIANGQYNSTSYCFAVNIASDGTLTNGSVVNLNSGADPFMMRSAPKLYRISNTSFLAVWQGLQANNNKIFARVCTVSGTTITMGTVYTLATGGSGTDSYEHNSCTATEMNTNTFLVAFNLIGFNNNYLTGMIITISGTTITTNTTYTLSTTMNYSYANGDVFKVGTNKAVVVGYYTPSSSYLRALVVTVSGTTLSASGEANIVTAGIVQPSNTWYYCFTAKQLDTNKFVVAYCTSANIVTFATFTLSGTTFTQVATTDLTITHQNTIPTIFVVNACEVYLSCYSRNQQFLVDSSLNITVGKYYTFGGQVHKTRQILGGLYDALIFVELTNYASGNYAFVLRRFVYDHARFVTSSNASYSVGNSVPLTDTFSGFSGLIAGMDYYVKANGAGVGNDSSYQKIGVAVSATKIVK